MKIALLSDCHGNLAALEVAMNIVRKKGVEKVYFLGDMVGYYPNPNECLDIAKPHECIMGNHEYACLHREYASLFNPAAKNAIEWTLNELTAENIEYIKNLPDKLKNEEFGFLMIHGALTRPFEYIRDKQTAWANFELFKENIMFSGHTHIPAVWIQGESGEYDVDMVRVQDGFKFFIDSGKRYIINVGSVGQPRDGNPDGCFVIFETDDNSVSFIRFEYPVEITSERAYRAGVDRFLCERIFMGM